MIAREPRTLGYYAGSHWFQWAVLFVSIGLLVVVGILPALDDASERAERQAVELTIRNMRTGMQLAMGEAIMRQREGEIATWIASNPVRWLGSSPVGYRGACSMAVKALAGGEWCFDDASRVLIYRPRRIDHLRPVNEDAAGKCERLSWRVVRGAGMEVQSGFVGLHLEAFAPCQWVLE